MRSHTVRKRDKTRTVILTSKEQLYSGNFPLYFHDFPHTPFSQGKKKHMGMNEGEIPIRTSYVPVESGYKVKTLLWSTFP